MRINTRILRNFAPENNSKQLKTFRKNMKIKTILATAFLLVSCVAFAQTNNETINKAIDWSKNKADKITQGSYDPDYVSAPKNKWMVFVSGNGGYNKFNMDVPMNFYEDFTEEDMKRFPEMSKLYKYKFRLHQGTQGASVGLGYGSIRAKYTFNIGNKNESQFNLEALGSRMGLLVDYRHSKKMKGTAYDALGSLDYMLDPSTPVSEILDMYTKDIPSSRNDFKSLHIQGHYVFNHRHFSYSAARTATRIQKRSAGSPIVLLDYYRSKAKFQESLLLGEDESYTTWKGSIGAGYAYNYTPNQGKVLIHASVIPSISLISDSDYDTHPVNFEYYAQTMVWVNHPENEKIKNMNLTELEKQFPVEFAEVKERYKSTVKNNAATEKKYNETIGATGKITLNCTARLSASWNINEHYVLGAYGAYQYSNYANKKHYSLKEQKFSGQIFLGYRF